MDRAPFQKRFLEAASVARDFAAEFLLEELPRECRFHVHLNGSYDANAGDDVIWYPQDSSFELALRLKHITADAVVDALWRDGLVPEWVNVSVIGRTSTTTVIAVVACGRFRADEAGLYHAWEGRPPFHVLGPVLPVDHVEGTPFSIYTHATCWTRSDLQHVLEHADDVWSLELNGPAFDDALLQTLAFPKLELLQLRSTPVTDQIFDTLARLPHLKCVNLSDTRVTPAALTAFASAKRHVRCRLTIPRDR